MATAEEHGDLRARALRVLPYVAIAAITAIAYAVLAAAQEPRSFFDSSVFLETAQQPWSWSHLFYPKPPVVPIVYRALAADPAAIAGFQSVLALLAWTVLAAVLALTLRRRAARIAAVGAVALFALAPTRIGYTHAVLSESINDSLQALWIAVAVLLAAALAHGPTSRRSKALAGALVVLAVAWMWTRDTNAIVVLVAVPLLLVARRTAVWRQARWLLVPAVLVIANAACVLWSTTVVPPPTGLSVHAYWPADFTARKTYPTFNNISDRLRDPEAVQFFVERGMPQADELVLLGAKDQQIYLDPHFTPARRWIVERASAAYVWWLVRHPIDRVVELAQDSSRFLGFYKQHVYMPTGWSRSASVIRWVRAATESRIVVLLLLLALPWCLRRPRSGLTLLAVVLVGSGLVGCAASYYGDSLERARHCYAAGQQVLVGLVLAVLARLGRD